VVGPTIWAIQSREAELPGIAWKGREKRGRPCDLAGPEKQLRQLTEGKSVVGPTIWPRSSLTCLK
jgi:hypothetical protein